MSDGRPSQDRQTVPRGSDAEAARSRRDDGPRSAGAAGAAGAGAAGPIPEQHLCTVRPAMFRAHPFRFMALAVLFMLGVALAIAASLPGGSGLPGWLRWPGMLLGAGAIIAWLWWWTVSTLWVRLEISTKRTIRWSGIVHRHSTEVMHDHVRSVDIRQGFIQRLFRTGTIGIDSAGQEGIEIIVDDIPDPYEIKKIIDRYRRL
ncbi:MAG: PH domain-containing protein [Phycisphaeraceae bacterium]|nr:PH domain-containing protein [Phycisphaeraceae bacterium]